MGYKRTEQLCCKMCTDQFARRKWT